MAFKLQPDKRSGEYRKSALMASGRSASGKAKEAKKQSSCDCGCKEEIVDIRKMMYIQLIMLLALFAFFLGVLLKYFGKI